jgi:sigma-B regulation protein RsbU (phosphoserine phosphatase)
MAPSSTIISERPPASSVVEQRPVRVLIVEDDPFTLTILKKRLAKAKYIVETATNGREGLEKADIFHPELILSDWMMPEMDGCEFCARIKRREQNGVNATIYFILLTAKGEDGDKVKALDTGVDEYLVKPCDGEELMARLRAAERIIRLRQTLSQRNHELQQAIGRINKELQATSEIQRNMLPQQLPEIPEYQFGAYYQPSTECSGDFYDVLELGDGRLGITIGDVSGHGAPAMVAMSMSRMLLRMESSQTDDPATLLF